MKLFGSPGSPYARKTRIVLEEKGIPYEYVIERPSAPGSRVPQFNPLGKIPVLVLDSGKTIYDSPVIVEYSDGLKPEPRLIPEAFDARIEVKRWEALGDGIAEATVAINHEYREPKDRQRLPAWFERHQLKIDRGLAAMEQDVGGNAWCFGDQYTLADIACGYALAYLDYALPDIKWRDTHPNLRRHAEKLFARPSFAKTVPPPA